MGTIQIKRGLSENLPSEAPMGALLFTTDTKKLYIGNGAGRALTVFENTTQLTELLNGKSNNGHTHTSANVTDFASAVDNRITLKRGQSNGLASLDENGKIPSTLIPSTFKEAEVCADIDERDTLTPFAGLHAFVIDASDDATVTSDGAEYLYNGTQWIKISELEGLDVSVTWENIGNKPTLVTTLLGLSDTPNTYANNAGKLLCVNAAGTGVEYTGKCQTWINEVSVGGVIECTLHTVPSVAPAYLTTSEVTSKITA